MQKQTSKKKNQSPYAKKFCYPSLVSGAPGSTEFIMRVVNQEHNTPQSDICTLGARGIIRVLRALNVLGCYIHFIMYSLFYEYFI